LSERRTFLVHLVSRDRDAGPDDRLAESIMGDRSNLPFDGNRYRVISVRRWRDQQRQLSPTIDFRLLPAKEARPIIVRMADSPRTAPADRLVWRQILERLLDGDIGRTNDEGVALLRYSPPSVRDTAPAAPAAPPPKTGPLIAPTDWIELGLVRIEGIDPGSCALSFDDLHAEAWAKQ
jgi:hypothetical protein